MTARDTLRLARDRATGVEAIAARFSGHAYDLHRHDEWLVGVTDHGVQDFHCRGRRRSSTPGRVILMEPGEAHDGQAGAEGGFAYRMLYLPQAWLAAALGEGHPPRFVATLHDDPPLATAIRRACDAVLTGAGPLARDEALDAVALRLRPHLGRPAPDPAPARDGAPAALVARRARDRLHDLVAEAPGLDALARESGAADRFHLARAFRAAYGTSPHAYLVQQRLLRARRLLASGESPAAVAAACGFADQSHLGRWFRRAYGLPPAAYRAASPRTDVPDALPAPR